MLPRGEDRSATGVSVGVPRGIFPRTSRGIVARELGPRGDGHRGVVARGGIEVEFPGRRRRCRGRARVRRRVRTGLGDRVEADGGGDEAAEAKEAMRAASLAKREAMELRTALAEAQAKVAEAEAAAKAAEAKTAEARAAAAEAAGASTHRPGARDRARRRWTRRRRSRWRGARLGARTTRPRRRGGRLDATDPRCARAVDTTGRGDRATGGDAVSVRVGHASNPGVGALRVRVHRRRDSRRRRGGGRGMGWGDARGERADVVHRRGVRGGGRGCWEPRRWGGSAARRRTAGATIFSILHRNARPSVVFVRRRLVSQFVRRLRHAFRVRRTVRNGAVACPRASRSTAEAHRDRAGCVLNAGRTFVGRARAPHLAGSRSRRGDELRRARTARAGASR